MSPNLTTLLKRARTTEDGVFRACCFDLTSKLDADRLDILLMENPDIQVIDQFDLVKQELIKSTVSTGILNLEISKASQPSSGDFWVYYPWRRALVHLPNRSVFVSLRTLRNRYKITQEEQDLLSSKRVGIIGLSVGQSIALPLAMERICGTLHLADFDTLELSNMNRIRSSLINLGLPKSTILAREIAEMDPFLSVELFEEGINESNIEDFLTRNGKLDLVVDECDDLKTKLLIRKVAKQLGIAVIMDTSDNLFLDIERYDIHPDYPIFHGIVSPSQFDDLHIPEKRSKLLFELLEFETLSERGKYSISEIGKSISTWPQLATDVLAGGAICAKVIRSILLGDNELSGRVKLDIIKEIKQKSVKPNY